MSVTAEIAKVFRFEAAHFLPKAEVDHQCYKMHGHSYVVTVRAFGKIDQHSGWVLDLCDLNNHFKPLAQMLDHSLLNNIEGLENPTSENLALWIFRRLAEVLPELSSVTVEATSRISVTIKRSDLR